MPTVHPTGCLMSIKDITLGTDLYLPSPHKDIGQFIAIINRWNLMRILPIGFVDINHQRGRNRLVLNPLGNMSSVGERLVVDDFGHGILSVPFYLNTTSFLFKNMWFAIAWAARSECK